MTAPEFQPNKPKNIPTNLEVRKKKKRPVFHGPQKTPDVEQDEGGDSLTEMEPRPMTPSDRGETTNTDSRRHRVTHDKLWLYAFLIHVFVYLGASAYINYLFISTRSLTTSLKGAGYCSLGSLARNAIFSDILESLCWPLEAGLDKSRLQSKRTANHHIQIVPWSNRALAGSVGAGMIWR